MDVVTSLTSYKDLVKRTKERAGKVISNCVLMGSSMDHYITEGRLFYQSFPEGMVFYADEGSYYELYYYWEPGAPMADFRADKKISIVEIMASGKQEEQAKLMEPTILAAGFTLLKTTLQLEANLNALDYSLEEELNRRLEMLASQGLSLRFCDEKLLPQVRKLWEEYLDPMDVPDDHLSDGENDSILCVIDQNDSVAAVKWWRYVKQVQEGRHTVTHPDYYRHGLGTTLLLAQFQHAREKGIFRNRTWVRDDNFQSLGMCQKAGLKLNGRVSKQYILQ